MLIPERFPEFEFDENAGKQAIAKYNHQHSSVDCICIPNVYSLYAHAFEGESNILEVLLPDKLEIIENECFKDCKCLRHVSFGNNIKFIGSAAFEGCSSLSSFLWPSSVVEMLDNVLSKTAIKHIYIPNSVVSIGNGAFANCYDLVSIRLPQKMETIYAGAFSGCTSLKHIVLPENLSVITNSLFYGCTSLESIVIPYGVAEIGEHAFTHCKKLKKIILPETVKKIGKECFSGCIMLEQVSLPKTLDTIEEGVFAGCSNLKYIELPEEIRVIHHAAFWQAGLISIKLPHYINCIANEAFWGCPISSMVCIADSAPSLKCYSLEYAYIFTNKNLSEYRVANYYINGDLICKQYIPIGKNIPIINFYDFVKKETRKIFWMHLPTKMPDASVNIYGYDVHRSFNVTYYIDNKLYAKQKHQAGIPLSPIDHPTGGCWLDLPSIMPYSDLDIKDEKKPFIDVRIEDHVDPVVKCWYNADTRIPKDAVLQNTIDTPMGKMFVGKHLSVKNNAVIIPDNWKQERNGTFSVRSLRYELEGCVCLGEKAFFSSDLESVVLPSSLLCYKPGALAGVKQVFNKSPYFVAEDGMLLNKEKTELFYCSPKNITVCLPHTIRRIHDYAFYGCNRIEKIILHEVINEIGRNIFQKCNKLKEVVIKSKKVSINDFAFAESFITKIITTYEMLSQIKQIIGNANVKVDLINELSTLTEESVNKHSSSVTLDVNLKSAQPITYVPDDYNEDVYSSPAGNILVGADSYCIYSENVTIISDDWIKTKHNIKVKEYLVKGIVSLGKKCFFNNNEEVVVIPSTLKYYKSGALAGAKKIINNSPYFIYENGLLMNIDRTELLYCSQETANVILPHSIRYVKGYAFYGCKIERIEFPPHLEYIEEGAFMNCTKLNTVDFPHHQRIIEDNTFYGCKSLTKLNIPESVKHIGKGAFSGCFSLERIDLPSSVTYLGSGCFCECSNLKKIELPHNLKSISPWSFGRCSSLQEIIIPESVTTIEEFAFISCSKISTVKFPDYLKYIGERAFQHCPKLKKIPPLPYSLQFIGEKAFSKTGLEEINILSHKVQIQSTAFDDVKIKKVKAYKPVVKQLSTTLPSDVEYEEIPTKQ